MHLWRDQARTIFAEWMDRDAPEACKCARCVPPKCIGGRWGAISSCESYVLRGSQASVRFIFEKVMKKRAEARQPKKAAANPDDLRAEEAKDYSERLGRWARDAIRAIQNPLFFIMMRVASRARAPLDAFVHSLKKTRPDNEPGNMARMVWGKAQNLYEQMLALLDLNEWQDLLEEVPLAHRLRVEQCISCLVMQISSDFERRVIKVIKGFPFKIFLLVKAPVSEPCSLRRDLCREIIDTPSINLPTTIAKMKTLFHGVLCACSRSGLLSPRLRAPIYALACQWKGHTFEIEGMNKIVQHCCSQAPKISLPLLDARVALRKELGG
eukprot:9466477-Pyramimonas_sp.AAC.1